MLLQLFALLLFLSAAPKFSLRDTAGKVHTPADWERAKAAVVFFVTVDWPIGNSYVPEMNRIRDSYGPRGVVVWATQADADVPETSVLKYATDYRYTFPVLFDPGQTLVRYVGATITPQAAVL